MSRFSQHPLAITVLSLACASPCAGFAADSSYHFQLLTQNEGLSESNVTAVVEDRAGFIWLGTQDGLDRFDGYSLRVFRHTTNDPDSLSDSYITALYVDGNGSLWVGTRNGLNRYDAGAERFVRYLNSESNPIAVTHMAEGAPGMLWLATDHRLLDFDYRSGKVQAMGAVGDASQEPLLHDSAGVTWVGTDHGLMQIDTQDGALRPVMPEVFQRARITALHEARDQALWVGTASGDLYRLAAGRGIIEPFPRIRALTRSAITDFADTLDGSLWVGTEDHGLVTRQFDGDWVRVGAESGEPNGLPSDKITGLAADGGGSLWVALQSPGVAHLNPLAGRFKRITADTPTGATIGAARAVGFDAEHRLWLGTETGIQVFDAQYHRVFSFPLRRKGLPGFSGSYVETVLRDHLGRMWVGLRNGGLCAFVPEPRPGHFDCYRHRAGDPASLSEDNVIAIAEDRGGTLWLGTLDGGLVRFDPERKLFHSYGNDPKDPHSLSSNKITSIVVDPSGILWVGSYGGGLNRFDPRTGTASHYRTGIDLDHALSSNNVVTLLQNSRDALWVATTGGLDRLDIKSGQIRSWTTADGLPDNLVFAMTDDVLGTLWLGTNNGLVQFDPAHGVRRSFSIYDGLPANEFAFGAAARSNLGTVFMGTVAGLVAFNPLELTSASAPTRLRFTGLTSYGMHLAPGHDGLLQTSITETAELALPAAAPEITLEFAALGSPNPSGERFAYRMRGLDDRWTYLDAGRHSVSFNALPHGHFTLEIQPADPDPGIGILRLQVLVPPPAWRSPMAYLAYLIGMLLIVAGFALRYGRRLAQERELAALSRENEARLQLALWASGEGTWDARPQQTCMYCTELMHSLGYRDMPQPLTTPAFLQLLHPDDRNVEYERYRAQAYSATGVIDSEFRIRNAKGEYVWWKMRGKVVARDAQGNPTRALGMAKDITADKEKQSQLQLAALFMQNSSDSIAVLDQDYHIIKVNKAFEKMTGYGEAEVLGKFPGFLSAAPDGGPRVNDIKELASRKGSWSGEGWIRRRSGENFLGRTQVNAVRDEHGNISHFVGITVDVTHQRLYEDELRHLASHDALTGLPNRTLLSDRLKQAIAACGEDGHLGVVILSLDAFSRINDSLGHDVGDEILRETARRLSKMVDTGDTVARVGGDTFALLLASRTSPEAAQKQVGAILQALAQPLLAGGDSLYLTASAGISLYPRDGEDPTSLIKNAEAALFRTKLRNRGTHTWYAAGMGEEAKDLLEMHTALHRAMDRDELSVHYQPKLLALTGQICGVEALVRWRDSNQRWVSPTEFIPVAETYGLIDRLGEWVLATAARDVLSLDRHAGDFPFHLAVNLSPKQMQQADLPERIGNILAKTGFPAERLRLELTENVLMHNPAESVGLLQALRALGIELAVDDFGTGYSSLGYLKHFPISEIKVDKSFVRDMDNRFTLSIVKAIVALGRSLEMEVTAEGVESRGQMEVLSRMGFTQLQGFFIAEPMDLESLAHFLVRTGPSSKAD